MGVLIAELEDKYGAKNPPLEVEAGIRQETGLDARTQLAFANVEEMDIHIFERLTTHEKIALGALQSIAAKGRLFFPLPESDLVSLMPGYLPEQRDSVVANIMATAAEAIEQFTFGDLYMKASERNPAEYGAKAFHYLGDKSLGRKGAADITLERATLALQSLLQNADIAAPNGSSRQLRSTHFMRDWGEERGEYRGEDCRVNPRCR